MSAFGGKADMIRTCADVRFLPKADIGVSRRLQRWYQGIAMTERPGLIPAGVCARALPLRHRRRRFALTAFGSRLGASARSRRAGFAHPIEPRPQRRSPYESC